MAGNRPRQHRPVVLNRNADDGPRAAVGEARFASGSECVAMVIVADARDDERRCAAGFSLAILH